eukprot:jgi/Pico_ML_1/53483/g4020.t1
MLFVPLQIVCELDRRMPENVAGRGRCGEVLSRRTGTRSARLGDEWAELEAGSARIAFKKVDSEAHRTSGYTPFLSFDVADMDATVPKLLQLGATLDGPIKYHAHGKVAAMRAPDGPMISLFEANVPSASQDVS